MEIDAKVTVLLDERGMRIEIMDANSGVRFCKVRMNPKATCAAMGRLAHTPGKADVRDLDKVGKYLIFKPLVFEIPDCESWDKERHELAVKEAERLCPAGWEADKSFNSQDSFWMADGKCMAKTTIRAYVGKKEHAEWKTEREKNGW